MASLRWTSEGPKRITRSVIEAAWKRRGVGARLIVRDSECRGLALVVNPTTMTWTYNYRPRGTDPHTGRRWPNQAVTIGNPETHSPETARADANRIKGQAASGLNPAAERKTAAASDRRRRASTIGRLGEEYALALPLRPKLRGSGLPSPKHVAEELLHVRAAIAQMQAGDAPASELSEIEIRVLLNAEAARPATARARFGALSRFLDWCQEAGHISSNPCALITRARRPKAPPARAHFLTLQELARLWEAADGLGEPVWRDLVRFLIAMPCRRSEAARLQWGHLDFQAAEWRLSGQFTKNREPHRLHLHPAALAIVRERLAAAGQPRSGLVFPAPLSGNPVDTFSDIGAALAEQSGVTGWTWHDFRRSFATALGEAGVSEVVADAILNHRQTATRGGVLGVYQRASRWPEQVKAMQAWGEMLADALSCRPDIWAL